MEGRMGFAPPRWWGTIPLCFFLARVAQGAWRKRVGESLWVCHISNLLLGLGLILRLPGIICTATTWLVPGLFCWVFDMVVTGERSLSSTLGHIGGMVIGLGSIRRTGYPAETRWPALILFFGLQLICRLFTLPSLNVNVAHDVRSEARWLFPGYRSYWAGTSALVVTTIWVIAEGLARRFPQAAGRES